MEDEGLKLLVQQADDLELYQLEAQLGVLAKDMADYLVDRPREDTALFNEVYLEVVNEIPKDSWEEEYLLPADQTGLPRGVAEAAARGEPDISSLQTEGVIHEWTAMAGRRLWLKFRRKFRETVCGSGGPYEQFKSGLLGQEKLPEAIVSALLVAGFSAATFWWPLGVYIGLITVKAGLKTYCE